MRVVPRSLFGRLMLVLASGLTVALLLGTAINLVERDSALVRTRGMQPAQRIADIVRLLDSMGPAERARIVAILNAPPLVVSLDREPLPEAAAAADAAAAERTAMFSAALRAALGDDRPIRVRMTGAPREVPPGAGRGRGPGATGAPMEGPGGGAGAHAAMHRFGPGGMAILTQVRLQDGGWATFDADFRQESASLPWRLFLTLAVLLASVLLLSWLAVHWITRPLHVLAAAADELGRDINRPPLPEQGPAEVQRAARAFNTMQTRLVRVIEDRTRILAAMSHDLKTPLTRMRLRAELLDDDELRAKFEKDLREMESMVAETLEFMRGQVARGPAQAVVIMSLHESLQADNAEKGRTVALAGTATAPCVGVPQLLKRCLSNLIDNAIAYGGRADIRVDEGADRLCIVVGDRGPGIPEAQREAVFEPFVRLEGSRNRDTGGTGLGLSIARNIARAHGGDVRLAPRTGGGLEAILTLPRTPG